MWNTDKIQPRDIMKLAFQYQQTDVVPYTLWMGGNHAAALDEYYGDNSWRQRKIEYMGGVCGIDNFMACAPMETQSDGSKKDLFGCSWMMGTTHHLVAWPLTEPAIGNYKLPDLKSYFAQYLQPRWPKELADSNDKYRIAGHSFGLFERAWSLRGFENFLMDLIAEEKFAEELLETITVWMLQSVDLLAEAPVDAVYLTDDHAGQRGMLMGADRWRRLFKPRWKRIYERIHHYGLHTIMHMCGDNSEVVPDLIEIGLDMMESCQPECMDIYKLKREYGRDIRFWGGLGAQSAMPFGTPDEVRAEVRRLKQEMGAGGGYILAMAKAPGEETPIANIAAFFEEASKPR